MAELIDIARTWKKKAAAAIYPGVDSTLAKFKGKRSIKNFKKSTAFKTGNLLRQFVRKNSDAAILASKMLTQNTRRYELVLDVAPDGATYGEFVHNGTSKMGERPYALIGGQDREVQTLIREFLDAQVAEEVQKFEDIFQSVFGDIPKT